MKKVILFVLIFAACKSDSRMYVDHTEGPYSTADDTLIIQADLIINHSGFQKIRNGKHLPKQHQVRQWTINSPDAPVICFDRKHAYWNNTIYHLVP